MATEQRFDNGLMLAYDTESDRIVFALYDHGQWSRWHDDGLSWNGVLSFELAELKVPAGAMRVTDSFARAWTSEKLSITLGYASEKTKQFAGTCHAASDGGHRITDSMGRVLLLKKNDLQTWQFLRMSRSDELAGEMEF